MNISRYSMWPALLLVAASTPGLQQPKDAQKPNPPAASVNQKEDPPKKPAPPGGTESFWQKALRILGISATPRALKGDDDALVGDVWIADLRTGAARRLTREGGYRSPLVLSGEQAIWALKGESVCEILLDSGKLKDCFAIKGVIKLAAVEVETSKRVLLLRQDEAGKTVVELLSLADRKRTGLPYDSASDEDNRMIAYLLSSERSYDGGKVTLYTQAESKEGPDDKRVE